MRYDIQILRRAQKELAKLPNISYERIKDTIWALANNPRPQGCKKLSVRDGWRIRVGNYRQILCCQILFSILYRYKNFTINLWELEMYIQYRALIPQKRYALIFALLLLYLPFYISLSL